MDTAPTTQLFAQVDAYIDTLFGAPAPLFAEALAHAEAEGLPAIQIAPVQGRLLELLARLCGARRILEIGTLGGYSALWLAHALPTDGWLLTLEADPHHAAVARANIAYAGMAERIEVREGRALELLPQLVAEEAGPFDLIFIDADKEPYREYVQWALRLARPGSLIVADNVVRNGTVLAPDPNDTTMQALHQFNAWLAAEPRVTATILPLVGAKGYDGLALAVVNTPVNS